jgi:pimeloyl-ACP methyl ester carboxylesterase
MIHAGVAHLRMWDEQVEAWRDRHRVIRYDTRGWGRTVCEDVPFSNIADVAVVMDHTGIDSAHLVGLSRGAMMALDFTVAHPERVRSLTWVAGGIRGLELEDDERLKEVWPEMERLEQEHQWETLVERETQVWTDGPGQPSDRVDPDVRRRMVEWNMENYRAEQPANQPVQPDRIAAEHLSEIAVPVLAIWGTFDESTVPLAGEHLVAAVPGARSHVFEGVAHMVNLERPAEFNRIVGDFIDAAEPAQR